MPINRRQISDVIVVVIVLAGVISKHCKVPNKNKKLCYCYRVVHTHRIIGGNATPVSLGASLGLMRKTYEFWYLQEAEMLPRARRSLSLKILLSY